MNNNQLRHSSPSWGVKRRDGGMLLKKEIEGNRIILRRGTVGNDRDGTPLLINGRGEAYRVLRISSGDEDDVKKSLEQMIRQFHKISMIEVKEMK
jgi:hypothetical protein